MTPATEPIEHHLGVAWHAFQYPLLYEGIPIRNALSVDYGLRFPVGLEAGASVRVVFPAPLEPSLAAEADLHLDVVARIGRWRPAAGLALGVSTRASSEVLENERPPGSYFADLGAPEPLWLDFTATPARFAVGPVEIGVARVGVGVSLLHVGRAGRWTLDVVSVSRTF